MSQQGWIKLHRQILENPMWSKEPFTMGQAWVDLLLLANHRDNKILINGGWVVIKRGQFHTSILKLSNRWRWSRGKTKRFLDVLKTDNMLDFECSIGGTTNGTTLTIVNYDFFQCDDTTDSTTSDTTVDTTVGTANGQRSVQRSDINKNDKNIKNEKNEKKNNIRVYFPDDEALNDAFKDFVDMRKKLKKPLASDRAITLAINKLNKLSNGDSQLAIDIINQSIMGSWLSFYPLTERKGERPNSYMEAINNRVNVVDSWLDDNDEGTV